MIRVLSQLDRLSWYNRASAVYLVLVVPLYWNFEAYDTTLWEKFLVAHIIVIRMAGGWCVSAWQGRENQGRFALDIPILLYLGLAALSWLSAINPIKSGMEVIRVLLAATIYFSVSRTYRPGFRSAWLGATSASLAVVSVIGILQYLGLGFLDWRSAGLPSSTFFYRNYAAMFVAIALPLTAVAVVLARTEYARVLHAVAGTLGSIYLIYTRTRGAWLGVGIAIAAIGVLIWLAESEGGEGWAAWSAAIRRYRKMLMTCGLVIVFATLLPPSRKGELETLPLSKESAGAAVVSILAGQSSGREDAWIQSLGMIADHPFTGVGIGNWDAEYLRYAGPLMRQDGGLFGRPHNDYLWVVAEMGILGLVLFLAIFGGALWMIWDRITRGASRENQILLTGLGAGVIAISVHAFFSFPRERMTATVIPFLLIGWIAAVDRGPKTAGGNALLRVSRPILFLALTLLTLIPTIQTTRAFRAYFWADAYRTFDRYEEALDAIDRAVDLGVVDYQIYELKTLIHHRLGDPEAALAASERLLDYHPYNPWSHHKVGLFHLELGNYAEARDAFREGLEYGPRLGRLTRDLGQAFEGLGQPDSAIAAYERALKIIPGDVLLRTKLASVLADRGDFEAAQEHIGIAAERFKMTQADADAAVVGDVAMKAKAYDAAVLAYGRSAALVPDDPTYLAKLAGALEANGDYEQAIGVLRQLEPLVGEDAKGEILRMIEDLQAARSKDG